jgi:hypothetical protein
MKQLFLTLYFLLPFISSQANNLPFKAGEELKFDIHYKYGLVMLKAGTANFKIVESNYIKNNSFQSTLDFKTSSFFDKIFKMRDTLRSHITEDLQPLYHKRSVNEGNYHFTEEMQVNHFGNDYTEVRIKRESQQLHTIDTILTSNSTAYDILNLILFIRSLDFFQMEIKQAKKITTFIGREKVTITIRYEGQSVVEKNETLKYKAHKIALDFTDSAFNESKNAIEIWMSDDENRIPLKIRAKLRIGLAEVKLSSWENLKYPFSSEVKIPVRKN